MTDDLLAAISGSNEVVDWFGKWPAFHDSEISSVKLHPNAVVTFSLLAWNMTKEVDDKGFYRNEKLADVVFRLEDVSAINISDLTEVGILFDLDIERHHACLKLVMSASYGINGTISFGKASVKLIPR
jgi:hypothetical protein